MTRASIDEKSQIQALDRTQPGLPLKPGKCGTMTHDYKCTRTTALFAALNILDGTVIGRCMRRHRHQEFIRFLNAVERAVPAGKVIHDIVDTYAAHKQPKVRRWLERHPRWTFHFTPTSASWLNAVEGFFATHTKRRLHRPSLEFRRDGVWRKNPLLKIEIGGQHDHVANCHAAWPRQHEHHHVRHFAGLQQTSGLLGFLQLLRRPVREQCADDGAG